MEGIAEDFNLTLLTYFSKQCLSKCKKQITDFGFIEFNWIALILNKNPTIAFLQYSVES